MRPEGLGVAGAAALALSALAPPAAWAQVREPGRVMSTVGFKDVQRIAGELGWKVVEVDPGDKGLFVVLETTSKLVVSFEGFQCAEAACSEWQLVARFDVDNETQARSLVDDVETTWASSWTDGSSVFLGRFEFTYGGMTEGHLANTFSVFEDVSVQAWEVIERCRTDDC